MDVQVFVQNVKRLLDERGISYSRAGTESGAGIDFVRNMERKGTEPSIGKVIQMADYLNVTINELLGEKKEPASVPKDETKLNTIKIAGRDGSLVERELTDEQLAALKLIVDQLPDADNL